MSTMLQHHAPSVPGEVVSANTRALVENSLEFDSFLRRAPPRASWQ